MSDEGTNEVATKADAVPETGNAETSGAESKVTPTPDSDNGAAQADDETKTYTSAELQAYTDRRVSQALSTQREKLDAEKDLEWAKRDEQNKRDSSSVSKEDFAKAVEDREKAEARLQVRDRDDEIRGIGAEQGLPPQIVDMILVARNMEPSEFSAKSKTILAELSAAWTKGLAVEYKKAQPSNLHPESGAGEPLTTGVASEFEYDDMK